MPRLLTVKMDEKIIRRKQIFAAEQRCEKALKLGVKLAVSLSVEI